jgi:hypothetical protein
VEPNLSIFRKGGAKIFLPFPPLEKVEKVDFLNSKFGSTFSKGGFFKGGYIYK